MSEDGKQNFGENDLTRGKKKEKEKAVLKRYKKKEKGGRGD